MTLRIVLCVLFSILNTYTDIKNYRIRNSSVISFTILSLLLAAFSGNKDVIISSLTGGAFMLMLFPLFALRMLGAGDVKALMAIGFMLGFPMAVPALTSSIIINGIIALSLLLLRKNGRERLKKLGTYLRVCFLTLSPLPYSMTKDSGVYRFSFGITAGMLWLLVRDLMGGR